MWPFASWEVKKDCKFGQWLCSCFEKCCDDVQAEFLSAKTLRRVESLPLDC
jgi:hypothetical protein